MAADQFMVRLRFGPQGAVGLVWYDTRRDPANHDLDVFGTVSTDGGQTFRPNFRISDQSFDASQGKFKDAAGKQDFFLGDAFGLALTQDAAYVVSTDTRAGNQDIFFRRAPLDPVLAPPNDRFEPNDTAAAATVVGPVVTRSLPRLALPAGDEGWFQLQSQATGTLTVTASAASAAADAADMQVEVRDTTGQSLLARSIAVRDAAGKTIGWRAALPSSAGQTYRVRVTTAGAVAQYSLDLESLTGNLGPVVYRNVAGALQTGDQAYYLLESAAAGVLTARLTPGPTAQGEAILEFLDAHDLSVLVTASGVAPDTKLAVKLGQRLLVRITGSGTDATGFHGAFRLELTNLDQFSSPAQTVLQFPAGAGPSQETSADFNGDGIPDLAVANTVSNVVSVSLGNGDGTFTAPRQFAVGAFRLPNPVGVNAQLRTYRRDLAAADFNGDGRMDLAVTNYDSADVSILLGRGDGTFQLQRRFAAASFPIGLAVGDVNGDGHIDLVVVDSPEADVPNQLAVLLGRGDGTFAPQKLLEQQKGYFGCGRRPRWDLTIGCAHGARSFVRRRAEGVGPLITGDFVRVGRR